MNEDASFRAVMSDTLYEIRNLLRDPNLFGDQEYQKGFSDCLFEITKILQEKAKEFGISDAKPFQALPDAEKWRVIGPSVFLPD